jgi:hypothetical protein
LLAGLIKHLAFVEDGFTARAAWATMSADDGLDVRVDEATRTG